MNQQNIDLKLENNSDWLFKYVSFNLNTIKILVNNEMWFGKPDIQNDPNEVEFIVKYDETAGEQRLQFPLNNELKEVIKKTESGKKLRDGFERGEFEDCLKKSVRNSIGICSMSEKYDDILMWSHYADSNKGICIVFKRKEIIESLRVSISEKVDYSDKIPQASFVSDGEFGYLSSDKDFFIHKFQNWDYEEEFRFVRLYNPVISEKDLNRLQMFTADCIEGVIIGERFSEKDFETLTNLLLKREDFKNIKFWQSEKNIYENRMRVYPIRDYYQGKMDLILDKVNRREKLK